MKRHRHIIVIIVMVIALAGLLACKVMPLSTISTTPVPSSVLLLPDLKAEAPVVMYIQVNQESGERELFFSTTIANIGDGPLEMIGEFDENLNKTRAIQRIKTEDGTFENRIVGYFVYHEDHDHWHFEDFAELEIFSLDSDGSPFQLMLTTGKTTFCLQDSVSLEYRLPGAPARAVYRDCDPVIQGLSVGWVDVYVPEIPGQQINIDGLPDDRYMIRVTADPAGSILEKDDDNNSAIVYIKIKGQGLQFIPPPNPNPNNLAETSPDLKFDSPEKKETTKTGLYEASELTCSCP